MLQQAVCYSKRPSSAVSRASERTGTNSTSGTAQPVSLMETEGTSPVSRVICTNVTLERTNQDSQHKDNGHFWTEIEVITAFNEAVLILRVQVKVKVKLSLYTHIGRVELYLRSFLTSALDGAVWSASRPGLFIPGQSPPVSTEQVVCAPEAVWTLWMRDLSLALP